MSHLASLWNYSPTLDYTENFVRNKHPSLLLPFVNYSLKKFYNMDTWACTIIIFDIVIDAIAWRTTLRIKTFSIMTKDDYDMAYVDVSLSY
jgi:hypothetical protein